MRRIVNLIVIAVGGLMILQYNLLRNTVELRGQTFNWYVFAALNDALDKIEEIHIRNRVFLSQEDSSVPAIMPILPTGNRQTMKKRPDQSDVTK